jgi:HsdM N-terminal domain
MPSSENLVQKLWNYCNILGDDGLSYGDYLEQLTFFLFLKMADEQSRPPFNKKSPIPLPLRIHTRTDELIAPSLLNQRCHSS